jgi:N-methylhydantoinase A
MGGTSTDVCLCPGRVPTTAESTIGGLPLRLPLIDIHTVGAGGGSIAFVDVGGALQVGPRSAGAQPGPACYGRGGELPTVTDANLVLGRLAPEGFLGGRGQVQIDGGAAYRVLAALGAQLGLSPEAAALGVVRVANATMERALRAVSVEQGYDPRAFVLLPFGGAGPLHACDLADALGMRRILFPAIPGVLSAFGMLAAEQSTEFATSVLASVDELLADGAALVAAAADLAARTRRTLGIAEGRDRAEMPGLADAAVTSAMTTAVPNAVTTAALDLRYRGQSYELTVPLALPIAAEGVRAAAAAFHHAHAQRYGYAMPAESVETVTLRVRTALPGAQVRLPQNHPQSHPQRHAPAPETLPHSPHHSSQVPQGAAAAGGPARLADRMVWFAATGPVPAPCYQREGLQAGDRINGPALLLQYDSTLLLTPGWDAAVDPYGNLVCEKRASHG